MSDCSFFLIPLVSLAVIFCLQFRLDENAVALLERQLAQAKAKAKKKKQKVMETKLTNNLNHLEDLFIGSAKTITSLSKDNRALETELKTYKANLDGTSQTFTF